MLGVKMYGGEWCQPGNIVMRQRGTEFHPGHGMGMVRCSGTALFHVARKAIDCVMLYYNRLAEAANRSECWLASAHAIANRIEMLNWYSAQGRDHTLFALEPGYVTFSYDKKRDRRFISIDVCETPRGPAPGERRPTHVPRRSQRDIWAQHPAQRPWLEQRQRISDQLYAAVGAAPP